MTHLVARLSCRLEKNSVNPISANGGRLCPPTGLSSLADQLTLFQPGGTDYAQPITTGTPGFSDLPTALHPLALLGQHKIRDYAPTYQINCQFLYLVNLSITHQFFYRIFSVESISSKNLNGIGSSFVTNVSRQAFSNRCIIGVSDFLK